jgi:hypothetical protein
MASQVLMLGWLFKCSDTHFAPSDKRWVPVMASEKHSRVTFLAIEGRSLAKVIAIGWRAARITNLKELRSSLAEKRENLLRWPSKSYLWCAIDTLKIVLKLKKLILLPHFGNTSQSHKYLKFEHKYSRVA